MTEDRITLVEGMDVKEAVRLIQTLPKDITNPSKRKGHKFVFTEKNELIIGKANAGDPKHTELGNVEIDKVAGYILISIDENNEVTHVYMNNQSTDFNYPPFENLREPQILITKLFGPISVDMEDIPKPESKVIILPNSAIH